MPYKTVKQYSDRGSIRDLKERQENGDDGSPATSFELRVKELYEYAMVRNDDALIESLGIIAINGSPKDPISVFRHREYVNSLSEKLASQVEQTKLELDVYFTANPISEEVKKIQYKQSNSRDTILEPEVMIKSASSNCSSFYKRSFKRVS